MGIGDRLSKARKERGVTQQALADLLGVKQASLSMIETGDFGTVGDGLADRIEAWISSGKGAPSKKAHVRGPYKAKRTRATLPR